MEILEKDFETDVQSKNQDSKYNLIHLLFNTEIDKEKIKNLMLNKNFREALISIKQIDMNFVLLKNNTLDFNMSLEE